MSTRSHIGLVNDDKSIEWIYCHSDGYPSGVGKTLKHNYTNIEEIKELLSLGDVSSLGESASDTSPAAYKNWKKENFSTDAKVSKSLSEYIDAAADAQYLYLFEGNKWKVYDNSGNEIGIP